MRARAGGGLAVLSWPAYAFRERQPYQALLAEELERLGVTVSDLTPRSALVRHDIWHLHWPERAFASPSLAKALAKTLLVASALSWGRRLGARLVWTVHNLDSHDRRRPWLEARFRRFLTRRVDGLIHLSEEGRRLFASRYPELAGRPSTVIPIGHFRAAYPPVPERATARARLGLPPTGKVLLFFGQIRPYKNVPRLLRCFAGLAAGTRLVIAGQPASEADRREVLAAADGVAGVHLALHFVPSEELPAYAAAADLVVLPYRDILNSGAALVALSFDRPVLVPRQGAMAELAATVGAAWVRTYEGDLSAEALEEGLAWAGEPRQGAALLDGLGWPALAARTLDFYRWLAAGSPSPEPE